MADSTTLTFGDQSLAEFKWLIDALRTGATNLSAVMMAMAAGYSLGDPHSRKYAKSNTGPRTEVKTHHQALMSAILVSDGGDSADNAERDQLASRYAEAGIRIIKERVGDSEDVLGDLVLLLKEALGAGKR